MRTEEEQRERTEEYLRLHSLKGNGRGQHRSFPAEKEKVVILLGSELPYILHYSIPPRENKVEIIQKPAIRARAVIKALRDVLWRNTEAHTCVVLTDMVDFVDEGPAAPADAVKLCYDLAGVVRRFCKMNHTHGDGGRCKLIVWNIYYTPQVIGNPLPEETRVCNRRQLDAVKRKLATMFDPNLLLCNMNWFKSLTHTSTQDSLFAELSFFPKTKLKTRLKEQLQEGVDACLPRF